MYRTICIHLVNFHYNSLYDTPLPTKFRAKIRRGRADRVSVGCTRVTIRVGARREDAKGSYMGRENRESGEHATVWE